MVFTNFKCLNVDSANVMVITSQFFCNIFLYRKALILVTYTLFSTPDMELFNKKIEKTPTFPTNIRMTLNLKVIVVVMC